MILLLTCASEETFLGEDLASICQCPIRYKKLVKSNRDALLVFDQIPGGDLLIPWLMQSLCLLPPLYLWIVCSWMFRFRFSTYETLLKTCFHQHPLGGGLLTMGRGERERDFAQILFLNIYKTPPSFIPTVHRIHNFLRNSESSHTLAFFAHQCQSVLTNHLHYFAPSPLPPHPHIQNWKTVEHW